MDFLSSLAKAGEHPKPTSDQPGNPDHQAHKPSSNSDLFASAKVIADAAQSQFRNEPETYDKTKVASAAADLLGAASEYGNLDETKGAGRYVEQAESYLRQYKTTGSAAIPASGEHKAAADDSIPAPSERVTAPNATCAEPETTEGEKPAAGGGVGDHVKVTEDFLNKPAASGDSGESAEKLEGGYGDLMKMAGSLFKK